jgi:hypothetical protein
MIKLNLVIENPWSDKFDPGYYWAGKITNYKSWEFQSYRSNTLFESSIYITHRCDHAGLKLEFGFFSFSFQFNIYDNRHWNYNTKTWEVYNKE